MEVKFMCPAIELCCEGDTFDIINKHALFTYDVCLFKPETHHGPFKPEEGEIIQSGTNHLHFPYKYNAQSSP